MWGSGDLSLLAAALIPLRRRRKAASLTSRLIVDSKEPCGVLRLGVAQESLHGFEVAGPVVNQRWLCSTQ